MVWGYVLYFALAIGTALVVAAEMATYSTRRERLLQMGRAGNRSARMALVYLRAPRWYLAGSQLATTLLTVPMGLLSGSLFVEPLSARLVAGGWDPARAETASFWTATLGLTAALTIFLNLLPKRFAFSYADEVAVFFAKAAWYWIKVTLPLLRLLNAIVDGVARLLRLRPTSESDVTEADALVLLGEGHRKGHIDARELAIARNALALSEVALERIMTPAERIEWIDVRRFDPSAARRTLGRRTLVPVGFGSLDELLGYVRSREVLALGPTPTEAQIRAALCPVIRLSASESALRALSEMKGARSRIAVALSTNGRVAGIATLNDLVSAVLGDFEALKT